MALSLFLSLILSKQVMAELKFEDFSKELIGKIMTYLNLRDLNNFALSCKTLDGKIINTENEEPGKSPQDFLNLMNSHEYPIELRRAVKEGNLEVIRKFVDRYRFGSNWPFLAAKEGQLALIRAFSDVGIDMNIRDHYGWTLLHHAISKKNMMLILYCYILGPILI